MPRDICTSMPTPRQPQRAAKTRRQIPAPNQPIRRQPPRPPFQQKKCPSPSRRGLCTTNSCHQNRQPRPNPGQHKPAARYYQQAQAQIRIDDQTDAPQLRSDRRIIFAEPQPGLLLLSSPQGPLTRAELDLLDLPTSCHLAYRLLPDRPVKINESWSHPDELFTSLARVQSMQTNTAKSTLRAVENGIARIALAGQLRGRGPGADTELDISGEYRYDLRQRRINWIQVSITERRSPGHTVPGLEIKADVRMLISPLKESSPLSDVDWTDLLATSDGARQLLGFAPAAGGFELVHDRRWHVVAENPDGAIFRYVDNGDLLAQCKISELTPLAAGKQIDLEQFQSDVQCGGQAT